MPSNMASPLAPELAAATPMTIIPPDDDNDHSMQDNSSSQEHRHDSSSCSAVSPPSSYCLGTQLRTVTNSIRIEPPEASALPDDEPISWSSLFRHGKDDTMTGSSYSQPPNDKSPSTVVDCLATQLGTVTHAIRIEPPETSVFQRDEPVSWSSLFKHDDSNMMTGM